MDYHKEIVLILDFGSQYTQLIARKVRELGVYCEIYPFSLSLEKIKSMNPKGIILSGGPKSVTEADAPVCDEGIFALSVPILGICYGLQLITKIYKGKVDKSTKREYGKAHISVNVSVDSPDPLLDGIKDGDVVWMSHQDRILTMPKGFRTLAHSDNSPHAAIRSADGSTSTESSSIPRSTTRRKERESSRIFFSRSVRPRVFFPRSLL